MSSALLPKFSHHPGEELLEEYHFGRVNEPTLASLEAHLLVCVPCQDLLHEVDRSISEIRWATALWERESRPAPRGRPFLVMRTQVLAATLAGLLVLAAFLTSNAWQRPHAVTPSVVQLIAMRGASDGGLAHGIADSPLKLSLDRSSLPVESGFRLEMVDAAGRHMWDATPVDSGTTLSAQMAHGIRAGVYWIRLYSSRGELLREYGMRVD